jgi:hypothetical protein
VDGHRLTTQRELVTASMANAAAMASSTATRPMTIALPTGTAVDAGPEGRARSVARVGRRPPGWAPALANGTVTTAEKAVGDAAETIV